MNINTLRYPDVRDMPREQLSGLASDVRKMIIDTVSENGGHLGSSLGAVELCIALLRKFDPREDKIVFDVGHQAYAYKILTDRAERFGTLRREGGLCGFPRRGESEFDHFSVGHSSTSISAALGLAKARDILGQKHHVVAFIGDGALINGLALEALNHLKEAKTRLIIVLNDNKLSISPRVGGFATMLARLSANTSYNSIKQAVKDCLSEGKGKGAALRKGLEGIHAQIKALVKPANMFDDLDINYWGPFDGHNVDEAEMIFELARSYSRPVLLHFITVKGKGMPEAEANPTKYHQMAARGGAQPAARTWSEAASALTEGLACDDGRIVCLTAAMATGVKLEGFRERFPSRFFDVGIAESHMLTLAAGMAAGGLRPWVFIYSTFLQRAMDQLAHDVALQNLPVVLMIDRAGLVGADGETHQGLLDVSWTRPIPNLEIYSPADEASLADMMNHAATRDGPTIIRYPRGPIMGSVSPIRSIATTKIMDGEGAALVGHGTTIGILLEARKMAERMGITPTPPAVFDLRRLKPLDVKALYEGNYDTIVVAEENYLLGGVGEQIASGARHGASVKRVGVPDVFVGCASTERQREMFGLTAGNVAEMLRVSRHS